MTAAHARERGLVDLGAEAGRSWPIIWETFGKLRPSSTERTQGDAVRLAMASSGHHLEGTHWKLWENSGSTWMRHGVDSQRSCKKNLWSVFLPFFLKFCRRCFSVFIEFCKSVFLTFFYRFYTVFLPFFVNFLSIWARCGRTRGWLEPRGPQNCDKTGQRPSRMGPDLGNENTSSVPTFSDQCHCETNSDQEVSRSGRARSNLRPNGN